MPVEKKCDCFDKSCRKNMLYLSRSKEIKCEHTAERNVGKSTLMNALVGERISIAVLLKRRQLATALWVSIIRTICRLYSRILRVC